MKKILFVFFLTILSGCSGTPESGKWVAYPQSEVLEVTRTSKPLFKNYRLGAVTSASVGVPIIQIKNILCETKAAPSDDLTFPVGWWPGHIIKFFKDYPEAIRHRTRLLEQDFWIVSVVDAQAAKWGVLISHDGRLNRDCIYSYDYGMLFYPERQLDVPDSFSLRVSDLYPYLPSDSYEIIFSGKNETSLNFTYREYSKEDLARPAFYQDLTYQPDAKQIRFKDFTIKVHDVSNEKITFTVIEDGF